MFSKGASVPFSTMNQYASSERGRASERERDRGVDGSQTDEWLVLQGRGGGGGGGALPLGLGRREPVRLGHILEVRVVVLLPRPRRAAAALLQHEPHTHKTKFSQTHW